MRNILERIKALNVLEIPKAKHSLEHVQFVFGPIAGETQQGWLVSCSHCFNAPAPTARIQQAEKELGIPIPSAYRHLLGITDGAKLFCVARKWLEDVSPGAMHIRFHLFSCDEVVEVNKGLLASFREFYRDDTEYKDCQRLNYMTFCDAEDGNYQSLLLDESRDPQVFLLFHEFSYRPYDERDADLNYRIAHSLQSWLELICNSGGWEGRGMMAGGL